MSVYAVISRLKEMKYYRGSRKSKYLDKFAILHLVSKEDISTVMFVLDSLGIPPNSEQEANVFKIYTKLLVEASHYGFDIDMQYWAYYNLLRK